MRSDRPEVPRALGRSVTEVNVYDLAREALSTLTQAGPDSEPAWHPDSRAVAVGSRGPGRWWDRRIPRIPVGLHEMDRDAGPCGLPRYRGGGDGRAAPHEPSVRQPGRSGGRSQVLTRRALVGLFLPGIGGRGARSAVRSANDWTHWHRAVCDELFQRAAVARFSGWPALPAGPWRGLRGRAREGKSSQQCVKRARQHRGHAPGISALRRAARCRSGDALPSRIDKQQDFGETP